MGEKKSHRTRGRTRSVKRENGDQVGHLGSRTKRGANRFDSAETWSVLRATCAVEGRGGKAGAGKESTRGLKKKGEQLEKTIFAP